jgi:hypothetical protein
MTYYVTYTGRGVVSLAKVGIFQNGTRACVDENAAREAEAHGHFLIDGPASSALRPAPTPSIPVADRRRSHKR